MFHIHVCGCLEFLEGYGLSPANEIMGQWFLKHKRYMLLAILFVNHPGWDLS